MLRPHDEYIGVGTVASKAQSSLQRHLSPDALVRRLLVTFVVVEFDSRTTGTL
jgi:hypothetical protein